MFAALTASLANVTTLPQITSSQGNSTASWLARRQALIRAALGSDTLPKRSVPDFSRVLGPAYNTTPGVEELVWDLSDPRFFQINSTVFYSPRKPGERSAEAFLFHHGHTNCVCQHSTACNTAMGGGCRCDPDCQSGMRTGWPGHTWWDLYNVSAFFHSLGHDVFILSMPLKGINIGPGNNTGDHWWFLQWEDRGDHPLRYFLSPIFLTINYATRLGYRRVHMAGLSGGGWSTTFAAAMDPRIAHSFPIAGSLPCAMRDPERGPDAEDFEQSCEPNPDPTDPAHPGRAALSACNYTCQYLLAALEPQRFQLQVLHEHDDCCFAAHDRHATIRGYEAAVRHELGSAERAPPAGAHGWFTVAADDHVHHEVCPRDKALVRAAHAAAPAPGAAAWEKLPCDVLRGGSEAPCPPDSPFPPDAPLAPDSPLAPTNTTAAVTAATTITTTMSTTVTTARAFHEI